MLPAASQATSVGRLKSVGLGGRAARGRSRRVCLHRFRPTAQQHHGPCPRGLNLITMLVPSSTAQMLSCGSTRTAWANAKP